MGVRNAGLAIKEARLKAGLTQEQLSEGICSVQSLSRIENNTAGVSPSTFQALMAHAGAPCEALPTFTNKTDFDCFYTLKKARFYLAAWQLREAFEELEKIENMNWADNKFYYQEWALLHCKLQFRSYCGNHEQILQDLISALKITRPNFSITDFRSLLLSITEIELFIALAQEYLYTNHLSECMIICEQIASYLENIEMTFLEKKRLLAEHAIVYCKYHIATQKYQKALKMADTYRHQIVCNKENEFIYELTFLTGIGNFFLGNNEKAFSYFRMTFLSSYAIQSVYATVCKEYWQNTLKQKISDFYDKILTVQYQSYPSKRIKSSVTFHDRTFASVSEERLSIGRLIHLLRIEKNISQNVLCQGLCSKSKLSKIENEMLQPDVLLTEALLQRLGISERIFSFWDDEYGTELYTLRSKLIRSSSLSEIDKTAILDKIFQLNKEQNPYITQFWLFAKYAVGLTESEKKLEMDILTKSLNITLPNFNFSNINSYRLSWLELTILNNLANTLTKENPRYKAIVKLQHILSYMQENSYDIFIQSNILSVTLFFFIRQLYLQGAHQEVIQLEPLFFKKFMYSSITFLGGSYFFFCQSLCECNEKEKGSLYAHIACALEDITEIENNSTLLKKYLLKDFGISIV